MKLPHGAAYLILATWNYRFFSVKLIQIKQNSCADGDNTDCVIFVLFAGYWSVDSEKCGLFLNILEG
jgi:hypothetical protein